MKESYWASAGDRIVRILFTESKESLSKGYKGKNQSILGGFKEFKKYTVDKDFETDKYWLISLSLSLYLSLSLSLSHLTESPRQPA